jgi:hypothetical protein
MSEPGQIPPTGVLAISSPEAAALEAMERRAKWCIPGGVVLFAGGALLLATSSTSAVRLIGGLAAFCGPGFIWSFACWRRLFAQARESLKESPRDFLLERKYRLSKTEAWKTRLRSTDLPERTVRQPVSRCSTLARRSLIRRIRCSGCVGERSKPNCAYHSRARSSNA